MASKKKAKSLSKNAKDDSLLNTEKLSPSTSELKKEDKNTQKSSRKKNEKKELSSKEKEAKAIEKYKNVPMNDLQNDLYQMKSYVQVLEDRRDELLKAKSHVNPSRRKEAIQKTIDNTYMIQFKYQDATFRNHFQPMGLRVVERTEDSPQNLPERHMERSPELRSAQNFNYTGSGIHIRYHDRDNGNGVGSMRNHIGMENRPGITSSGLGGPSSFTSINFINRGQDGGIGQRTINYQGMQDRSGYGLNGPGMMPPSPPGMMPPGPPGMMPPGPPGMMMPGQQTMMMQQSLEQQHALQGIVPLRVIDKPVVPSNNLDVFPLYDRIRKLIKLRKSKKGLFIFLIGLSILLMIDAAFFILWGFAVNWTDWTMDLGKAFSDLFEHLG